MKNLYSISLILFLGLSLIFTSCEKEDDSPEPTPPVTNPTDTTGNGGGTGACNSSLTDKMVKLGDTTLAVTNITCNPNAFGIPRLGFTGKSSDNSISVNVELRGTAPNDGSTFTQDPDLGNKTSRVKVYLNAKNWTSVLDSNNTIYYSNDGTTQTVCGTDLKLANNADASETMLVSVNISCP